MKDIMILRMANALGSPLDTVIGLALMNGEDLMNAQELNNGRLRHLFETARHLQNLPPSHQRLMQEIHDLLNRNR